MTCRLSLTSTFYCNQLIAALLIEQYFSLLEIQVDDGTHDPSSERLCRPDTDLLSLETSLG